MISPGVLALPLQPPPLPASANDLQHEQVSSSDMARSKKWTEGIRCGARLMRIMIFLLNQPSQISQR
ncbi:hypothetical protein L5515_019714 [Caenorhabditis briggsae]|uniref:Uncharacterized protein n=1 Tax=Caenorhabditis briggsae TaxID=6238 RepID=A0AAE9JVQ8_CAEBR|nr:hypothetical protein L5515_019714 [Caenorhabditis briggsae]